MKVHSRVGCIGWIALLPGVQQVLRAGILAEDARAQEQLRCSVGCLEFSPSVESVALTGAELAQGLAAVQPKPQTVPDHRPYYRRYDATNNRSFRRKRSGQPGRLDRLLR